MNSLRLGIFFVNIFNKYFSRFCLSEWYFVIETNPLVIDRVNRIN